jgi:DNA-directed RNA polymerase specialized sigma24 family protein
MDNIIDYMESNRGIKNRLQALYDQLQAVRSAAVYSGIPLHETSDIHAKNKLTSKNDTYIILSEEIQDKITQLQEIHVTMIRNILLLDYDLQSIATQYYIDGLAVNAIARQLNCDRRTIYNRLQIIKNTWKNTH